MLLQVSKLPANLDNNRRSVLTDGNHVKPISQVLLRLLPRSAKDGALLSGLVCLLHHLLDSSLVLVSAEFNVHALCQVEWACRKHHTRD